VRVLVSFELPIFGPPHPQHVDARRPPSPGARHFAAWRSPGRLQRYLPVLLRSESGPVEVTTQCGAHPEITCKGPITSGPFAGIFEAGWDHLAVRDVSTSTSRMGTFAQYGVGTALVCGSSGWLGYGRFDYRTGENIEGYSVNAGLRYNW